MAGNRSSEVNAGPLYICHGGKHDFTFKALPDSPWVNQGVSLNRNSADPELPVTTIPNIAEYQPFDEQGVTWSIDCPRQPADAGVKAFQLWAQTEFTAAAYKVDVSLGHHRIEFDETSGDEQFQVIEFNETTTLTAREISYYTREAMPFEGQWKLNNENLGPAKPGADGRVSLDFKKTTAGTYPVRVVVPSLYYESGTAEYTYNIQCLAKTPWGNDAVLQVNDKTEDEVLDRGVVCTRGKPLSLKVLNENLLLKDSTVSLNSDDAKALGLTFNPDLGVKKEMLTKELSWALSSTASANSGLFKLQMHCSKLKRDWDITGHLLSAILEDEVAKVEVEGAVISDFGAVFFREETRSLTVTFAESMRGLSVALEETGSPGNTYNPALKTFRKIPADLKLDWQVTGGTISRVFTLQVVCADVEMPLTIQSRVLSKVTSDGIQSLKINGQSVDLASPELIFFRAGVHEVELIPKPDSSLIGLKAALKQGSGAGLGMTYDPPLDKAELLTAQGLKWKVTGGAHQSGLFGLFIYFPEVEQSMPLACRLLSSNLADETTVMLDGVEVPSTGANIMPGDTMTLTLAYKNPQSLPGLGLALDAVLETGLSPGDLISRPTFRELTINHEWVITSAENKVGSFKLRVFTEAERAVLITPSIRLLTPINFRFESFGGNPLFLPPEKNLTDTSTFFSYRIALTSLDGRPLVGVPLTFYAPGSPEEIVESTTNNKGLAFNLGLYERVGVYSVRAVAKIEDINRELEILVDVVAA